MFKALWQVLYKYALLILPLVLIVLYVSINFSKTFECNYIKDKKFKIFEMGYVKYANAYISSDILKIEGVGDFKSICSGDKLKIISENSNSNLNFEGRLIPTLYGFIYSDKAKRMGISVVFKNPIIYSINILLVLFLTLYFIKYNKYFDNVVKYSLLPLLGFTFYYEVSSSLSGVVPGTLRYILFALVLSRLLIFNNVVNQLKRYKHIFILFFIIIAIIFYRQDWVLSVHPAFGRHWFYLLDSLVQNQSLTLGSIDSNGLFFDALVYKNNGYMPNNIGPVIFPYLFGSEFFKIGILIIATVTAINFHSLYEKFLDTTAFEVNKFLVLVLLLLIVTPAIVLSGTYYPIPQIGSAFFISLGLASLSNSNKISNRSLFFFSLATLFRIESILLNFLSFLFYKTKSFKLIILFGIIPVSTFLLSNYAKFDQFFQSGIGYNHNINNPLFSPLSTEYLYNNIIGYFFRIPHFCGDVKTLFLKFDFNGSEPGGYFIIKYPLILVSLYTFIRYLKISEYNLQRLFITASGFAILMFYLLGFNTSPKYDVMYAPLLIFAIASYPITNKLIRSFLITLFIIIHLSVLMNLIVAYPFYK